MANIDSPVKLLKRLVDNLFEVSPQSHEVRAAEAAVKRRHEQRRESRRKNDPEYVVERLLRPKITAWAAEGLAILPADTNRRIYSSHFHTTDDLEWEKLWKAFRETNPDVDVRDSEGHRRRADLFIDLGRGRLVSIDFKYVKPGRLPDVRTCERQLSLYTSKHRASMVVIYTGSPASPKLLERVRTIRNRVRSRKAYVVAVIGADMAYAAGGTLRRSS